MQLHISYPDKVTIDGLEERWIAEWERQGVYRFDDSVPADAIFSIDTPPPTVSGSLHIGHVFSYTHTDVIARYKRMRGFEVFYPMGFDDNGVPTERRVQNYYGVRCEPTLPYDPSLAAPEQPFDPPKLISRRNFIELCELLTKEDEKVFEKLWRHLGLSVDWSTTYTTVGALARKTSQRAFLDLLEKGKIYASDAPTLWDIDYQTAVAQAELEDRPTKGTYFRVYFPHESGTQIEIETSRPELIAACIAIVAHPDDERYQHLFGTHAYSPLFGVPLPIHPHPLASPDKGTGIAMVSSFGDLTDVTWWRELGLPTRVIMTRAGRLSNEVSFRSETFPSRNAEAADAYYQQIANKTSQQARKIMGDMLAEAGLLASEPKEIEHVVKYYEKGDRPLEIVASRQWYVRTLEESDRLIELGRTVTWHPSYMRLRYENWVEGLNSDWNISRQRFFGIPMPVWYHTDGEGAPLYDQPILPDHASLPIDPQSDTPPGFDAEQRNQPHGFCADLDIMDTWATSSLTPQIATGWAEDDRLFRKIFPMDLRPQGHDIIRTWLFYTALRSLQQDGRAPWRNAALSGFVLDPDRKKMSKSKGNVVTPLPLLERHGADAVRYWAACGRPGTDTAADEGQMKVGRRLAIKIANASKFVLSIIGLEAPTGQQAPVALDLSMLEGLERTLDAATSALEEFDYTRALDAIESSFWDFCDNYLEIVKVRAYGNSEAPDSTEHSGISSARAALVVALSAYQRAFAPFLPYVSAETWSWWNESSVHRAPWPSGEELRLSYLQFLHGDPSIVEAPTTLFQNESSLYPLARDVISEIRRSKTEAKRSMKTAVERVVFRADEETLRSFGLVQSDLAAAGVVSSFVLAHSDERGIEVTLEDPAPEA